MEGCSNGDCWDDLGRIIVCLRLMLIVVESCGVGWMVEGRFCRFVEMMVVQRRNEVAVWTNVMVKVIVKREV